MPIAKTKHVQLFWKDNQNVTFYELNPTLKKVIIGCIFVELYLFFCFSAAGGGLKLMKHKHMFDSPKKTEL